MGKAMPTSFRPYAPDQDLLLPPSLGDWLPEGHLAYFISDVVEELELAAFYAPYEGDGRRKAPYEPSMMLKTLLYAYSTGVFSSRKIAKKLEEDVAFRVLGANNFPQHRTICDFRKRHLEDFKSIFVQVVQIASGAGLVRLGTVAIDGTKVRANASKHKAMSYGRMQPEEQRLEQEIAELCGQARSTDEEEDRLYGKDRRGDELPEELQHRQDRLEKIRQAKASLEQAQSEADAARGRHPDDERKPPRRGRPYKRDFGVPADKSQSNFTDPESRIMKTAEGYQQCYNGQLAVDDEFQLIVSNALTNNASDNGELIGLVAGIERTLDEAPKAVLADAGYRSEPCLVELEQRQIDAYVSVGREGKSGGTIDAEAYPATARMADKLEGADGKARYAQRKALVEPANGWIKHVLGFRRFSFRGLQAVRGEWDLICLATNLRRMQPLMIMD
jgi:transposase